MNEDVKTLAGGGGPMRTLTPQILTIQVTHSSQPSV